MMSKQSISEDCINNYTTTTILPNTEPKRRAGEIYYKLGTNGKLKKVEKLLRIIKEANCVCHEEEENHQENFDDQLS